MTRTSKTGAAQAISWMTAATALMTGMSAGHADELADLRANQELLQRRYRAIGASGGSWGRRRRRATVTGGSFPRSFVIPGDRHLAARRRRGTAQHRLSPVGRRHRSTPSDQHARLWRTAREHAARLRWALARARRRARRSSTTREAISSVLAARVAAAHRDAHPDRMGRGRAPSSSSTSTAASPAPPIRRRWRTA